MVVEIETSQRRTVDEAIGEIAEKLADHSRIGFLLLLISSEYPPEAVAAALMRRFPGTPHAAYSSLGEFASGIQDQPGIVAMGFPAPYFQVSSILLPSGDDFETRTGVEAIRRLRSSFSKQPTGVFAITLLNGLSRKEEVILSLLQRALEDVPVVGGSSGGSRPLADVYAIRDGKVTYGAGIVLIMQTAVPFRIFKSDYFAPTDYKLVVTSCDPETRTVYEFNAENAAAAYAYAAGIQVENISESSFSEHLLLIKNGEDYFCRSIQRINPDGSLVFHGAIGNGLALTFAHTLDMADNLECILAKLDGELGGVGAVIGFDCIQRSREAKKRGIEGRLSSLYKRYRVAGFLTYGEQYYAMHLNNTFTGIAFGRGIQQP